MPHASSFQTTTVASTCTACGPNHPGPTRLGLRVTSDWQCVLSEFLICEGLQSVVGGDTFQDAVVHHAVDTGAVSLVGSHARTSLHPATQIRLERIEHTFYY